MSRRPDSMLQTPCYILHTEQRVKYYIFYKLKPPFVSSPSHNKNIQSVWELYGTCIDAVPKLEESIKGGSPRRALVKGEDGLRR